MSINFKVSRCLVVVVSIRIYLPLEMVKGGGYLQRVPKKEKLPYGSFSLDIGYDTKGRAIFPDIGLDIKKFS